MPISDDKKAEMRVKSLEMIQAIISRMAGYSAGLKNYCVTLTTALAGYAISVKTPMILFLGFLPIVIFSILDAYYLGLERRFRRLYDARRCESWADVPTFEMSINDIARERLISLVCSQSILWFYAPLALALLLAICVVEV